MQNTQNDDINFLFELLDKNQEYLLTDIQAMILNKEAAIKAVEKFDKYYFAKMPASIDFKVKLASLLIDLCKKFNVDSRLWQIIKEKNPVAVDFLDILGNKGNFI